MSEAAEGFVVNGEISNARKSDDDNGYADFQFDDDDDWENTQRMVDITSLGPLQIDTNVLGHDALEIPSPTFPCVSSSVLTSDFVSLHQHCGDVEDSTAYAGMAGLCNLGNTCFMNSGLQCLLSNDRLVKYFIEEFNMKDDDTAKHTLAGNFCALLHRFWQGGFSSLYPAEFKTSVSIDHPQFSDHRQHDCQEFLALLLDSLHEYLNLYNQSKPNNVNETSSPQSACQDADQPDFGSLFLDSDQSVPVSEITITHPNSPDKDSTSRSSATECIKGLDLSDNLSGLVEDASTTDSVPGMVSTDGTRSSEVYVTLDGTCKDDFMDVDDDNFHRKIPCIDDFCSKDTKTLNTNVLVTTDDVGDLLATDSVKFHKQDNTSVVTDEDDIEDNTTPNMIDGGQLREFLMAACPDKPMKDTNLVANCHDKFSDEDKISLKSALWDQTINTVHGKDCFTIDGSKRFFDSKRILDCERPDLLSSVSCHETDDEKPEDINNIKRIKIDDQAAEKNMRMQAKLKVNVEPNHSWCAGQPVPSVMSGFGDQLCASPLSVTSSTSMLDGGSLLPSETVSSGSVCSTVEGLLQMQYERGAERAWQSYTLRNQSIIVSTFQGQFKSTVVCSECRHISVTFEPFMYLSVPLPHALERQIAVVFVPSDSKQPVRYLLKVHRLDLVRQLRAELIRMIGEDETCDIVIAEVLDHHVARILEDSLQMKMVNDSDRMIYAFEMLPMPVVENLSEDPIDSTKPQEPNAIANNINTNVTSSFDDGSILPPLPSFDGLSDIVSFLDELQPSGVGLLPADILNNSVSPVLASTSASESMSQLESNPDVDWQHNVLNDVSVANTVVANIEGREAAQSSSKLDPMLSSGSSWPDDGLNSANFKTNVDAIHCLVYDVTNSWNQSSGGGFVVDLENCQTGGKFASENGNLVTADSCDEGTSSTGAECGDNDDLLACARIADQWKSCVICLEEMADSELKAHASCGGTLCHTCLEMSTKHLGSPFSKCPVCTGPVTADDDFIPLSCMDNYKPKTRILSVPVVNRYVDTDSSSSSAAAAGQSLTLFGHPNVLYLPNKLSGSLLYQTIDRVVPLLTSYSIVLTNGQGSRCSRCLYTQHCTGCELSRDADEIMLQPGDHLAVQFGELSQEQIDGVSQVTDHQSMETMRPNSTMTLYDCFRAFTESEVLDEHNPWFCPRCHKNQCASKTMSVWRYPDTLIVYLKRFVYHELSSTKIDNKVDFPLEDLDLSDYISGPSSSDLIYDLQSCVLHYGGVNSGHYTAYARHPVSGEWLYTNDETVVKQSPSEADSCHVYILFYQRRGTQASFNLPPKTITSNGDNENAEEFTRRPHGTPTSILHSSPSGFDDVVIPAGNDLVSDYNI